MPVGSMPSGRGAGTKPKEARQDSMGAERGEQSPRPRPSFWAPDEERITGSPWRRPVSHSVKVYFYSCLIYFTSVPIF